MARQRFEQLGELRAFGGVGGTEGFAGPALHASADALDDGPARAARWTRTRRRSTGSVRR
ncbi:hypothetical protein BJF78_09805 [Pseudonocardia sp. CNS-139]|nr:hypothetical protein BJF78_09805 [Pseudonocardia sp. CNS-139]